MSDERRLTSVEPARRRSRHGEGTLAAEWLRAPRTIRLLVVCQLLAIVVAGTICAVSFRMWSPIDEGAHFDYIQTIAEDGRLPELGDPVHEEMISIAQGTYPRPGSLQPGRAGLWSQSYEAFQPPLYYTLAAPVFSLTDNYIDKAILVRLFGLVLLLAGIVAFIALARLVVADRWPMALAYGLLFFMAPGVVLRSTLIGNGVLMLPLVTAFTALMVLTIRRSSRTWLAAGGIVLGLCLLDSVILVYLVPVFITCAVWTWWHQGHRPRDVITILVILALPLVMLMPWLAMNVDRYDSVSGDEIARAEQQMLVNPTRRDFTLSDVPDGLVSVSKFEFASEWNLVVNSSVLDLILNVLQLITLPLVVIVAALFRRRALRDRSALLCAAPLLLAITLLAGIMITSDWPTMFSRYVYGALPAWFLFGFVVYESLIGRWRYRLLWLFTAVTGFALVVEMYGVVTLNSR